MGGPRSRHWQEGSVPEVVRGSNNLDVYRVACSTRHAMLITRDGDIYTWGCGVGGVLGHGGDMDVDGPKHVAGLALERVRQVGSLTSAGVVGCVITPHHHHTQCFNATP